MHRYDVRPTDLPESCISMSEPESPECRSVAWLIVLLSAGNFVIGMGAFVVIGILTPIADSLDITPARAGSVMTVYALAYAVGSPLSVALSGKLSRRLVLLLALLLFTSGSLLSAMSSTESMLWLSRIVAALGAGLFTPVAAGLALAISVPGQEGRSLARVFLGLTLAQVLGVPAGSFIGYTYGWSAAFLLVAVLGLLVCLCVWWLVPATVRFQVNSLRTLGEALKDWRSVVSVMFTATFLAAIYVLYTYLQPLVEITAGFGRNGITAVLLAFGVGAVVGNIIGGRMADTLGPYNTLRLVCVSQLLIMPLFSFLPYPDLLLFSLVLLWSVCGWSFLVAQQTRLVSQTPSRQNVVLALNAAAIYIGTALGSAIGGWVVETGGVHRLGIVAGIGAAIALCHVMYSERLFDNRKAVVQS